MVLHKYPGVMYLGRAAIAKRRRSVPKGLVRLQGRVDGGASRDPPGDSAPGTWFNHVGIERGTTPHISRGINARMTRMSVAVACRGPAAFCTFSWGNGVLYFPRETLATIALGVTAFRNLKPRRPFILDRFHMERRRGFHGDDVACRTL